MRMRKQKRAVVAMLLCIALAAPLLPLNVFAAENTTYRVVWKNDDGTVLETDAAVTEGEIPNFGGALPTKAAAGSKYYTFAGWSPALGAISSDMTYTATFHETDRRVYDGMEIGMRDPDADLLHLAIMTDPHVPYTSAWGSFNGKLCADVYANRLQDAINRGAEAVLVTGDLTAESRQSEYDLYHETVAGFADRLEIIESIGNHEHRYEGGGAANRRNQLKNIFAPRWRANMDTGLYFSQWVGNTHIIALGNDYYGPNGGGA